MPEIEAEVAAAADRVVQAFGRHDVESYFACFAEDASFVFYSSPEVFPSRAAFEQEWKRLEREDGYRVVSCDASGRRVQVVTGDVGLVSHHLSTRLVTNGQEEVLRERETIVFRKGPDGEWRIVHEHLSPSD